MDQPRQSQPADTPRIIAAITGCLPPQAPEPYEPTDEEIRLATPSS